MLTFSFYYPSHHRHLHSFPTRRSSDLWTFICGPRTSRARAIVRSMSSSEGSGCAAMGISGLARKFWMMTSWRSEEHTSELQSRENLVCRLLLEKKKIKNKC